MGLGFLQFFRRAIPFTLLRDMGGFGVYFGSFSLAQSHIPLWVDRIFKPTGGGSPSTPMIPVTTTPASPSAEDGGRALGECDASRDAAPSTMSTATALSIPLASSLQQLDVTAPPAEVARSVGSTAICGGVSGLATYMVRSPCDTLYKQAVGWRPGDTPLWSWRRFIASPRGLKAVGIGAATWSAYELADACLRALAAGKTPFQNGLR